MNLAILNASVVVLVVAFACFVAWLFAPADGGNR